jgi:hypothetical protein
MKIAQTILPALDVGAAALPPSGKQDAYPTFPRLALGARAWLRRHVRQARAGFQPARLEMREVVRRLASAENDGKRAMQQIWPGAQGTFLRDTERPIEMLTRGNAPAGA